MRAITLIIARAAFGIILFLPASASALTPQSGQWWNPKESGTGYNIDVHNGVLVVTVFTYKTSGDSEWYLASGAMTADQHHFTGTLDKYRNGQCISCAYSGRPSLAGNDGLISIDFLTETSAIVTLPGGRVTKIEPFFPAPTSTAESLNGTYQLARGTVDYFGGQLLDTAAGNFIASGTMVISGNQLSQTIAVTVNGTTIAIGASGTFVDYGAFIVYTQNGVSKRAPVILRSPLLATETINPGVNGSPIYAEVDQWVLVSHSVEVAKSRVEDDALSVTLGGSIGAALIEATKGK